LALNTTYIYYVIYLDPPAELLAKVFPWVEEEQAALLVRARANPLANDMALKQFLQLLIWLRRVLLQDAAVLFSHNPTCPIFQHPIFQTAAFHRFSATSQLALAKAEERARLAFRNLPDNLVRSLRGVLADMRMEQQQDREKHHLQLAAIDKRFNKLESLLESLAGSKSHGLESGELTSDFSLL
jgi:hypothetical protein